MRWRIRLAEYDFDIGYRQGAQDMQPDSLSRLPSNGHTTVHADLDIPCFTLDTKTYIDPPLSYLTPVEEGNSAADSYDDTDIISRNVFNWKLQLSELADPLAPMEGLVTFFQK